MARSLNSWSWQDIHATYESLGEQLREYERISKSLNLKLDLKLPKRCKPGDVFAVPEIVDYDFVSRWYRDVNRIDAKLSVLDREIARRNQLIGVMG